ncbi:MAG: YihY/virulence factor BrkB family protein [Chitinophagales bacterium]|nr:YihY/virulence factor BrkB family protein [Chitinophagales bacterium]
MRLPNILKNFWSILKSAYKEWNSDDPFALGAVTAYYAIFSLPALLVIIITVAGFVFGQEAVTGQVSGQISEFVGPDSAKSVEEMIKSTTEYGTSWWAVVLGVVTLIFGATGVFYQLQKQLNRIWGLEVEPKRAWVKLIKDRATSLGVILAIGFLLLISLMLTSVLSVLSKWIEAQLPDIFLYGFFVFDFLFSASIITLLFAMIFKILPDAHIPWRATWIGAAMTTLLFLLGKFALGIYFGQADPASAYGAAGSVVLILLWVNYSSLILFFGAEFTQVYARHKGIKIRPKAHANFLDQKVERGLEKIKSIRKRDEDESSVPPNMSTGGA